MILSTREATALARIFGLLAEDLGEREVRLRVGQALLDLLQADHFASFVWDAGRGRFDHAVALQMDPANLARYDAWYQFRDPITLQLQARRHATAVSEVMPHEALRRTEFFNDFLARDGLHWGINLHAFDGDGAGARALGDLRIWRGRHRREFDRHDKALLGLIEPAFIAALKRARAGAVPLGTTEPSLPAVGTTMLSPREHAVAQLVARGFTDKAIARELAISVSSVRTYLKRLAEKSGARRRAEVASLIARQPRR